MLSKLIFLAIMSLSTSAQAGVIATNEKREAVAAAKAAGLMQPFVIRRVPAKVILERFDIGALTEAERAELSALDNDSPLCGPADGSTMEPCPVRTGTEFGVLTAKSGGCIWSPLRGLPAKAGASELVLGITGARCSADPAEWKRIQRTSLPRQGRAKHDCCHP